MLCLLAQLQKKLQPDFKINNTENHQKIKLFGSPTIKDLKKPHPSRWVVGLKTQTWAKRCRDSVWHGEVVE